MTNDQNFFHSRVELIRRPFKEQGEKPRIRCLTGFGIPHVLEYVKISQNEPIQNPVLRLLKTPAPDIESMLGEEAG